MVRPLNAQLLKWQCARTVHHLFSSNYETFTSALWMLQLNNINAQLYYKVFNLGRWFYCVNRVKRSPWQSIMLGDFFLEWPEMFISDTDNKKGDVILIIINIPNNKIHQSANWSDNDRIYKQLGEKGKNKNVNCHKWNRFWLTWKSGFIVYLQICRKKSSRGYKTSTKKPDQWCTLRQSVFC